MNLLFTICGRAGSKGVKGKNIRNFCGVPLVWYTLSAIALYKATLSKEDTVQVVLNTDSEELIQIATAQSELPVFVVHRDSSLAGDVVPKVSVILDCLEQAERHFGCAFDMVVDLDITSPLRTVQDVANAVEKKRQNPDMDVVYSVTGARRNPYFNMVREENGYFVKAIASCFTTRQQAPVLYDMNASIYAYSPYALRHKEHKTFFNDHAGAVIMKDTGILDIDSEEDYELMQVLGAYFFAQTGYREIAEHAVGWK